MKTRREVLWYDTPASRWEEALPLGNGRLGAMVWGWPEGEILDLNEETLWSGFPRDGVNYEAARHLAKVRTLLQDKKYVQAQALAEDSLLGVRSEAFQPLGSLLFTSGAPGADLSFARSLDLDSGIARVQDREAFVSARDQVLVYHWPQATHLEVRFSCPHPHTVSLLPDGGLLLAGQCPSHVADNWRGDHPWAVVYEDALGLRFQARLAVILEGGVLEPLEGNSGLLVRGAQAATFVLAAASNGKGNPETVTDATLKRALRLGWKSLRRRHIADHRELFRRVSLDLGAPASTHGIPTDRRLQRTQNGAQDPALAALLFQYGRYLLMACSRPGGQAAHLQGLWNPHVMPPWNCNYTININTQMNYWPAETANLAECHQPLFDLIAGLAAPGERVARIHYGCRGWTAHHNVDFWRTAGPSDGEAAWAFWPLGGAWLCRHLWEHWLFGLDRVFLQTTAWPLMRGAALFCLDWLVKDGDEWTTSPSTSPENTFATSEGPAALSVGSTMDIAILKDVFAACLQAARELNVDDALQVQLQDALDHLPPFRVAPDGRLAEWSHDLPEVEPGHRHFSHLYGLYPAHLMDNEDLRLACRKSLDARLAGGGGHTGWSAAWLIHLWARLGDGEAAHEALQKLLQNSLLPNLFGSHPPFQIDANFGFTSAVAEMLLQSHSEALVLLPALPRAWNNGQVRGLRARGGFEVSLCWARGRLLWAHITSRCGGICRLTYRGNTLSSPLAPGETWSFRP